MSEPEPQSGDMVSVKLNDENGSTVVGTYERAWQDGMVRIKGEDFALYVKTDVDIRVLPKPRPPEPCRSILIGEAGSPEYDELWVPVFGESPFGQTYMYNPRNGEPPERDTWQNLWARTQGRSRIRIYAAVEDRRFVRGEEIT